MSNAPGRIVAVSAVVPIATLTKAQHRVLAYLALHRSPAQVAVLSSRQITAGLGISRRTVQAAIDKLNELQCIRTYAGSRSSASEHTILQHFTITPGTVRTVGGAISEDDCGKAPGGGGAISEAACEKAGGYVAQIAPPNPQVRGAISGAFPQALYKERACACADLYNSLSLNTEREGSGKPGKPEPLAPPGNTPDPVDEVVMFAEVALGHPLDRALETKFRALPTRFPQVPIARICDFVALKCGQKEGHEDFTPGALEDFCRKDLEAWWSVRSRELAALIRAGVEIPWSLRKPPQLAQRAQAMAARAGAM